MKIVSAILLCLFLVWHYTESNALQRVPETVRVGIFPFNPVNYIDKDGTAQGVNPDLLREIFREEKTRLAFVPGSWAEGLKRLQEEKIDLMMSVAYSDERAEFMDYGKESVLQLWGQVFARKSDHSQNISDLFGKRVGVMRRDISARNFKKTLDQLGGSCVLVEYPSHGDVFRAVQTGEVAAGVAPQHYGLRHSKEYDLVGTSILFAPFSIYFTTTKGKNPELLDHIDFHLNRWKNSSDSFYFQTLNRWMAPVRTKSVIPNWVWFVVGAIILGIVISTIFLILLNRAVRRKTRALADSEKRFRDVALTISDWIWEVDREGRYTYCSEHVVELLGFRPDEMIGRSCLEFVPKEDRKNSSKEFSRRLAEGIPFRNLEQTGLKKDGSRVDLLISALPIWDSAGDLVGFRGVETDISAQKKAERETKKLEEKLAQAQKMEAIGTLAGGIAHDFNNILAASLGYTELALEDIDPATQSATFLKESLRAGLRARDLVRQILAFSRQAEVSTIALRPQSLVKEAVKMLRSSLPATIEIKQNVEQADETILMDPTQFHQVIMNICTNAFHAMEEKGGRLDISLKKVHLTADDLQQEPEIEPGWFYQLSVADTGAGIEPAIRENIFDPYFTTKEQGKGTGMGLAIVHGIVRDCGGFLSCYSQLGEGTVFHLFFPCETSDGVDVAEVVEELPMGNERILMVDDEEMIVSMSQVLLENLGYSVRTCTDPREAFLIFQKKPDAFDLVISDQTMPGLTGMELARKMLETRPNLPIILCSGHSSTVTKEGVEKEGIRRFAIKPLVKSEIAHIIRETLDG